MQELATFKPLTNRSTQAEGAKFALPADGFVQLVPKGSAPTVRADESRIIQLVDDIALKAQYDAAIKQGGEVLVDFEHFSHEDDKATDAAAWQPFDAENLQLREDGIYGKPRWSDEGLAAVTGGRLRFISPEFPDDDEHLVNVQGSVFRPMILAGFGLTNRPGFKRSAKPLTNSDRKTPVKQPQLKDMHKALLALALGLAEKDIDGLDEPTLRNRAQAQKAKADSADAFKTEVETLKNREVEDFITANDTVIPKDESVRTLVKDAYLKNRESAEKLVKGFGSVTAKAEHKPLHNRQGAERVLPLQLSAEDKKQQVLANRISNRANQMLTNREYPTWAAAFAAAQQEITE